MKDRNPISGLSLLAWVLIPIALAAVLVLNGCGSGGGTGGSTATDTGTTATAPPPTVGIKGPYLVAFSDANVDSYQVSWDYDQGNAWSYFIAPDNSGRLVDDLSKIEPGIHTVEISAYNEEAQSPKVQFRLEITLSAGLRYYTIDPGPLRATDPAYQSLFTENLELTRNQ